MIWGIETKVWKKLLENMELETRMKRVRLSLTLPWLETLKAYIYKEFKQAGRSVMEEITHGWTTL